MTSVPVMVDSPSWAQRDQHAERVLTHGSAVYTVRAAYDHDANHWRLQPGLAAAARAQLTSFSTADLREVTPAPIRQSLARLDGLQRFGAASYWEALATAVIRQVIRAGQARRVWHRLAAALTPSGEAAGGFPTGERFLAASDGELAEAGLGFKTRTLRAVAEACRSEQRHWDQLTPIELHDAWLTLPGIGPWSAGAAIADLRNAWQLYPHDDLAVRTWAIRAFPGLGIPTDPRPFLRRWTDWGGPAIGTLTVLTLGWSATCP
jgi:DNA-3-methyladenine glycosylase II